MEFFVRGLSPPGFKQKVNQHLIEDPPATWHQLKHHIATKNLNFAFGSEFTGIASSSVDNKLKIEGIKDQLEELTGLMKDHKINAAYNPNEPINKQNHTRFCKWCRRSCHTISVCFKYRDHKEQNQKPPQYGEKFQTITTEDLDSVTTLEIIKTTILAIKKTTVIDLIPHIPGKSIAGLITLIDPDPKVLDPETEPPITKPWTEMINIVKSTKVFLLLIIIIKPEILVILFLIETKDHFYTRKKSEHHIQSSA